MYSIGFDVGGTNIVCGLVDRELNIVEKRSVAFPKGITGGDAAVLLADMARDVVRAHGLCLDSDVECIGVAVPGSIDAAHETVIHAHNLLFHDVPLRSLVQAQVKPRVYIENDANAATLAELKSGVLYGCNVGVLMTLGTGVGGGLVIGGKMFSGGCGRGVEIGHMIIDRSGQECTCGTRGCAETLCAATWLAKEGRRMSKLYPDSLIARRALNDDKSIDAKLVIDCAKSGDRTAVDIFSSYVDALSDATASIVNILDPEVIAIGGGVSGAGDFLFEPLRVLTQKKCFFKACGSIVPARMGNDAGVVGAAILHMN